MYRGMDCLQAGEKGRVWALELRGAMRRRLQDMGLVEGTEVECVLKSPSGDPTAYGVRGALIALRAEDARQVLVTKI